MYPFPWIQVQILRFSMLKEACQADSIVGQVWLFSYDHHIIFPSLCIHLQQLLAIWGQPLAFAAFIA